MPRPASKRKHLFSFCSYQGFFGEIRQLNQCIYIEHSRGLSPNLTPYPSASMAVPGLDPGLDAGSSRPATSSAIGGSPSSADAASVSAGGGAGRARGGASGAGRARGGRRSLRARSAKPVIAVERRHEPDERPDGLQVAALDRSVGKPQRLGKPRDLHVHITLRRVQPPLGDRPIDLAPDRRGADLRRLGDLPATIPRRDKVEKVLPPRDPLVPSRPALGSNCGALRGRFGVPGHGQSPTPVKAGEQGGIITTLLIFSKQFVRKALRKRR